MADIDRSLLRSMIFDGIGGRRFTQDTPILPDVWMAYGAAPDKPQDLLLIPHHEARAGQVAQELRAAVGVLRSAGRSRRKRHREAVRIAHMPGIIAANLHFDELISLGRVCKLESVEKNELAFYI